MEVAGRPVGGGFSLGEIGYEAPSGHGGAPPAELERSGGGGVDADSSATGSLENDDAVGLREKSVVASAADIRSGVDSRAPLPNKNAAAGDKLSPVPFHAESLGGAFPAVAGAAHSFFMSHRSVPCPV